MLCVLIRIASTILMSTHSIHLQYRTPKRYPTIISIVPPGVALIVTCRGSNYRCLGQIFMIPKGFEPSKFDCKCFKKSRRFVYMKCSLHAKFKKKMMSDRKTGYSPLNALNSHSVTHGFMFAYAHEKINNLLSVLSIFFLLFYVFNLNTQCFVFLEFIKYQVGLHRNVQIFAKGNVCISAIQLFYIQICKGFLPSISK